MFYICSLPTSGTEGRPKEIFTDDAALAERFAQAEDRDGRGVYECLNPLVPGARRRSLETVAELRRIYFDLDLQNIDAGRDEVLRRLQQLPFEFTWVRDSGSGNLHVGVEIKDPPPRDTPEYDRAVAVWKRLVEKLAADPAPAHPAALIRRLGTHNRKNGNNGLCEQLWNGGMPFDITELEALDDLLEQPLFTRLQEAAAAPSSDSSEHQPVDVEAELASLDNGVSPNIVQRRVVPSLLRKGEHPDDVLERVVAATMAMAERKGLPWTREVEVKAVASRIKSAYDNLLLPSYDPASGTIPDWLPAEFHVRWLDILMDGGVPFVTRNRSGYYVCARRNGGGATDTLSQADSGNRVTKTEMIRQLLLRGTTVREVLEATGWPSVSLAQHARRAGLRLVKYTEDGVTRYKGTPEGVGADAAPQKTSAGRRVLELRPFRPFDVAALPPRSWLYGKHYQRRTVSLTAGPGGMGKSSMDMVEAVAMATVRNLLGEQPEEQLRIWYHNGEDPLEEIYRRLAAICQHYKIPQQELQDHLWVTSGSEFPLRVAKGYTNLEIDAVLVRQISAAIADNQIDLAMFDPFVTLHSVSEVDTGKMDAVVRLFAGIADDNDAAIEIAHHVRKPAAGSNADYDVHDIRGVAAITDAVRAARVLNRMNEKDAEAAGCSELERLSRFRVDRAKGNYSAAQAATWRQFVSVELPNGDDVGVVAPWNFPGQGEQTPEKAAADQKAEHIFLQLLDKFISRGINVSAKAGPNYAPVKFAEEQEAKTVRVSKAALKAAMNRLLDAGRVRTESIGRSDRSSHRLVPWHGAPQ